MSKAEDRAYECFPNEDIDSKKARFGFLIGYHQAEKDLELTWEDLKLLQDISHEVFAEVANGSADYYQIYPTEQSFLEEVLKRFNEQRNDRH